MTINQTTALLESPLGGEEKESAGAPATASYARTDMRGPSPQKPFSAVDNGFTGFNLLALGEALRGNPVKQEVRVPTPLAGRTLRLAKRAFDIVFSACALLLLLPVLILCAIVIRLSSKGPILFRQKRLGQGGAAFTIVKFRTMVVDSEARLQRLLATDERARREWDADHKLRNDPRITPMGGFMRRFSLDELPQFWNVLVGDMSLVGPRPIVSHEIARYQEAYRTYSQVRPGITGLWQVSGRNDTGYTERVALDCRYVQHWSPMLDLSILAKTVGTVIGAGGAY